MVHETQAMGGMNDRFSTAVRGKVGPEQEGYSAPPRPGLVKVFRSAGCWVYRVSPDQEQEFCQWVREHLGLPELGRVKITGEFPMLRVFNPFDDLVA
jgi:hypothetical protein